MVISLRNIVLSAIVKEINILYTEYTVYDHLEKIEVILNDNF